MRNVSRGFTLIELLIAMSLAFAVIVGAYNLLTSMFRFQLESLRKSTVTGSSLTGIGQMNKDIEAANVMVYPTGSTGANALVLCMNWSRSLGGPLDAAANVTVLYYCYDTSDANNPTLRRLTDSSMSLFCPANSSMPDGIPACNASWSGVTRTNDVIASLVFPPGGGLGIFQRDDTVGGVRVSFDVGRRVFTHVDGQPDFVNPQFIEIDTRIAMNRPYLNSND